ncbi:MAG TPA: hypothetical protein VNQ50_06540 [Xanthobacteraceae bacterium]|jgi:hypothetical protein|nr:hypothetical protein [Xanthobacteraceae bacterium]
MVAIKTWMKAYNARNLAVAMDDVKDKRRYRLPALGVAGNLLVLIAPGAWPAGLPHG